MAVFDDRWHGLPWFPTRRPVGYPPAPRPVAPDPRRNPASHAPTPARRAPSPPSLEAERFRRYEQPRPVPVARPEPVEPTIVEAPTSRPTLESIPAPIAAPSADREALRKALKDLEDAEARVQRNAERIYDETRSKLVSELLPIVDNLDRSIAASTSSTDASLVEGVRMVRMQLDQVLSRYGAERIDAVGEAFDPALHHAIAIVQVEPARDGRVVEQVEAGYRYAGKVLRAAKVVVGRSVE